MEIFSIEYALLAVQVALLGVVTPELRAVVVDLEQERSKEAGVLYMRFYYDGKITEELEELWSCAVTEASADLGADCFVDDEIERLDFPQEIPLRGRYAYLRYEDFSLSKEVRLTVQGMSNNSNSLLWKRRKAQKRKFSLEKFPLAYALLAMQTALLGIVAPSLRAVIVDFEPVTKVLYVRFYHHGEVSEELIALWNLAIVEASEDLVTKHTLDKRIERLDFPQKIPFHGEYAYLRKEEP